MKDTKKKKPSIYELCKKTAKDINNELNVDVPIPKVFLISYLVENQGIETYIKVGIGRGEALFPIAQSIYENVGQSYGVDLHTSDETVLFKDNVDFGKRIILVNKNTADAVDYFVANGIKADLIHIDCSNDIESVKFDYNAYLKVLNEEGFIIFDKLSTEGARNLYNEAKEQCPVVFETEEFGILLKEKGSPELQINTKKLSKRLFGVYESVLSQESIGSRMPSVAVGVLAYNHSDYIDECLESVARQTGNFRMRIIICDDCSTDDTNEKINNFIKSNNNSDRYTIEYIKNPKNLGMIPNFAKLIEKLKEQDCDYVTFCEGDDYYSEDFRIREHISLCEKNPQFAITFNPLVIYWQKEQKFENMYLPHDLLIDALSSDHLAASNFIGNLACTFIRGNVLKNVNQDLFDMYAGDWMLNFFCSQFGDIGMLDKKLNVYRKHEAGAWALGDEVKKCKFLLKTLDEYDKYFDYTYFGKFNSYRNSLLHHLKSKDSHSMGDYGITVLTDLFPATQSGFSYYENLTILKDIPSSLVITTGILAANLAKTPTDLLIAKCLKKHPETVGKLYQYNQLIKLNTKLLYGIFLFNTYHLVLPMAEKFEIPFVFTLYPGSTFAFDNKQSDKELKRIFDSPFFRKVIVTQTVTRDYLLKKSFCKEADIEFIFGVVTPPDKLALEIENKKHYGIDKETLDICFVAFKYTEYGEDKGYDKFIEAAKKLSEKYDNIHFHIVGNWDENVVDLGHIKHIQFYGKQSQDWFDEFYADKDIIISPNVHGKIRKGSFDGFPTGCLTDAALRKVAMFGTDPLELNNGVFEDGKDFIFIEPNADDIVSKVEYYYNNPGELKALCENGQKKVRDVYSFEKQLQPRLDILNTEIQNSSYKELDLSKLNDGSITLASQLFMDYDGNGFNQDDMVYDDVFASLNGYFLARFKLTEKREVKRLRFDPDDDHIWDIRIDSVIIDGKPYQATAYNSIAKFDEYDCFPTHDPIYHIDAPESFKRVEISGYVRPASISSDDVVNENKFLKQQIAELNMRYNMPREKAPAIRRIAKAGYRKFVPEPLKNIYRKIKRGI